MGLCEYCGQKAGLFSNTHSACLERVNRTREEVRILIKAEFAKSPTNGSEVIAGVQQIVDANAVQERYVREAAKQTAGEAIMKWASTTMLSDEETAAANCVIAHYDLKQPDFEARLFPASFVTLSHLLWQLATGMAIEWGLDEPPSFNLQRTEIAIYQTGDTSVMYAEERTVSNQGRSYHSLSVPLGHDVSYRIGNSQANAERATGLAQLDIGKVLITDRFFYFGGSQHTLKIDLGRVLRYVPYLDGVGICETNGAPKVFIWGGSKIDLGWYVGTLLAILTQRLSTEK
jgi:hypothetical protein